MAWGNDEFSRQLRGLIDDAFEGGAWAIIHYLAERHQAGELERAFDELRDDGTRAAVFAQMKSEFKAATPGG